MWAPDRADRDYTRPQLTVVTSPDTRYRRYSNFIAIAIYIMGDRGILLRQQRACAIHYYFNVCALAPVPGTSERKVREKKYIIL